MKGLLRKWKPEQHWHIDAGQRHYDTYQSLTHDIAVNPEIFFAQVAPQVQANESGYAAMWECIDQRAPPAHPQLLQAALLRPHRVRARCWSAFPAAVMCTWPTARRHAMRNSSNACEGIATSAIAAPAASMAVPARPWVQRSPRSSPPRCITGDMAFCYDSNAFWNKHLSPEAEGHRDRQRWRQHLPVHRRSGPRPGAPSLVRGPPRTGPHGPDRRYGLPCYEALDKPSLKHALDRLYETHDGPAFLVVRTDAELSPKVLRDYFKELRG